MTYERDIAFVVREKSIMCLIWIGYNDVNIIDDVTRRKNQSPFSMIIKCENTQNDALNEYTDIVQISFNLNWTDIERSCKRQRERVSET